LNGLDAGRDFTRICQELAERFHINIDEGNEQSHYTRRVDAVPVDATDEKKYQELKEQAKAYLAECAKHLDDAESYLKSRGISLETARRFGLGYDSGYLVIPSGDGYNKRNTNPDCKHNDRFRKAKDLKSKGFGWDKLEPGAVCWVVEGEIDALSLFEAGQIAAGLGGVGNVDSFCKDLESRPDFTTNPPKLILALDNDDKGQEAQDKLEAWLKEKGTPYEILNGSWKVFSANEAVKDANEALCLMGLEAFRDAANEYVLEFKDEKQRSAARYLESNVASKLHQLWSDAQNADSPKPTGFNAIDKILGGGLRPGLYVFGAIPSLGKTALVLQIANNLAKSGIDILYFSLEMPASDLVWRSVSCISYVRDKEHALSQRELQFKKWDDLGPKHENALNAYDEFARTSAKFMWIQESIGGLSVDVLEAAIANHKAMRGCAPVVVVDYLQIMQPHEPHMTDKAALDYNSLRLKQISNRYQTPMLIISSFNRANYGKDAGFESFKESGAIEYCSDCLFALQFKEMVDAIECASSKDADKAGRDATKAAKAKETREIELVVLKNRMGQLTDKRGINMSFVPKYNYFACDDYFD
jgi:replicative DNA helicase